MLVHATLFDKAATMKCTESLDMIASPLWNTQKFIDINPFRTAFKAFKVLHVKKTV